MQIWGKICHKYEGMTDMLTGTMMEELANIITYVTGVEMATPWLTYARAQDMRTSARRAVEQTLFGRR